MNCLDIIDEASPVIIPRVTIVGARNLNIEEKLGSSTGITISQLDSEPPIIAISVRGNVLFNCLVLSLEY
jgi:hypothetical protein